VLFSFEPNVRAFTDGTQRLLRNAVFGPAPEAAALTRAEAAARVAAAKAAAGRLSDLQRPLRVTVASAGAAATERLLAATAPGSRPAGPAARSTSWSPTPAGLAADEHPFATALARRLRAERLPVRAFSVR
jgi:hypothetical protein